MVTAGRMQHTTGMAGHICEETGGGGDAVGQNEVRGPSGFRASVGSETFFSGGMNWADVEVVARMLSHWKRIDCGTRIEPIGTHV